MAAAANLRGGYPSARVWCQLCTVVRWSFSGVAACAVADGPGAPIVEYCVHFVLGGRWRPQSLLHTCVLHPSLARLFFLFFSILRALRARVERAAALDRGSH